MGTSFDWAAPSARVIGLWLVLSFGAAAVGPFGTYEALSFGARLVYWAVVVGVAIALFIGMRAVFVVRNLAARLVLRTGYVALMALFVYVMNSLVFTGWTGGIALAKAFGYVLAVAIVVEAVAVLIGPHRTEADQLEENTNDANTAERAPAFSSFNAVVEKLDYDKRAPLVHLEAQDHYLRVVTELGEQLVLMRLGDAVALLPPDLGLQVHRSHWVAFDAIEDVQKRNSGQDVLLKNGAVVPVSRARMAELRRCREGTA